MCLIGTSTFANIDLIDISKISTDATYIQQFNFLKDNKKYYAIYTPEWKHDKPKEELYELAIKENPQDVRGPWFLGYHYALANMSALAAVQFAAAQKLPLGRLAVYFWNDYGYMAILGDMPSTALHAMKSARKITGNAEVLERTFGESVSKRFIDIDKDKEYKSTDIWIASTKAGVTTFASRPLAIKTGRQLS